MNNETMEALINSLPQETADKLKVSMLEAADKARATAKDAYTRNLPLSVKEADQYYINVEAIYGTLTPLATKILLGTTTTKDLDNLIVTLDTMAAAAKYYVDEVDTLSQT